MIRARSPRVALATARPRPDISTDHDLPLLRDAVTGAGAGATVAFWDDPDVDWDGFDLVVVRSTWDYVLRAGEFLDWTERCGKQTVLANPPSVLRWNADKRYLGELAAQGVPTVPTRYAAPGEPVELPLEHEYVIKPTTGAGARYAGRYLPGDPHSQDDALLHVQRLHAEGMTAMVQPYQRQIDITGERALVFYGGRFVHAIRKNAVLARDVAYDEKKNAHPGKQPWTPTEAELAVAERALAAAPDADGLLYGRVDLADDDQGEPQVMELELIEPNLFLTMDDAALPTVATAIVRAAETAARSAAR